MIGNLPKRISTSFLSKFEVGESEAVEDKLLNICFCNIEPIKNFLDGNYEILYGAKGAGKTAIFTSIVGRKIKFKNENKFKQIIVPIDQELEYCSIKSRLDKSLKSEITEDDTRYRFLWEIYILYRISLEIRKRFKHLPENILNKLNELVGFFCGDSKAPTLTEFLLSSKRTVGFKLNYTNPSLPTPDFYLSAEPQAIKTEENLKVATFNLEEYKSDLSKFVRKNNSAIFVLIDRLDDFVAKEAYDEQINLTQGLVKTARSYSNHSCISIKLFLRTELFKSLDFSQLGGYDKIEPKAIELKWSSRDIRTFLALRTLHNLTTYLKLNGLQIAVKENDLFFGPKKKQGNKFSNLFNVFSSWFSRRRKRDQYDSRDITLKDQLHKEILNTIFPLEIDHCNLQGKEIRCSIFDYFENHFNLANGETTPRIMLIFLKKVISISKYYYANNLIKEIPLNEYNRYALISRDHIRSAYAELQGTMVEIFLSCITNTDWRKRLETFFLRRNRKSSFSYKSLQKMANFEDDDEFYEFISYLSHLGIFHCKDKTIAAETRTYEIPIILQKCQK